MRSAPVDPRAGVTLAELLVVLLIIGLTAGVAGLSVATLRRPPEGELGHRIQEARAMAIRAGTSITVLFDSVGPERRESIVRFLPDGRVIGAGVDPWTGIPMTSRDSASP